MVGKRKILPKMMLPALPRVLIFAILVTGCAVEISQTPSAVTALSPENTASTQAFPSTQVPVTWKNLNLDGKLIYPSSTGEGNTLTGEIHVLDLTTGTVSTLFSVPGGWIYYVSLSPDAKWLVLSYSPPAEGNSASNRILYLMPAGASQPPQPLFAAPTPDDHYTQAEWSPDEKYLYYVHYNHNEAGGQTNEVYEIFRMTYPAGSPEKIADHAFWPRLSPDSTSLVYVSLEPASGKNELFVAGANGSNPQQIPLSGASVPDIIDAPLFSPDGQSILFSAPSPGQSYQPNWLERLAGIQIAEAHNIPSDWWSVPLKGGAPVRLTHIQETGLYGSLSPDHKHLASLSAEGIFVMELDGSNLTQLISDPGVHGTVIWIP